MVSIELLYIFLIVLGALWLILPFALFGIKPLLKKIEWRLQAVECELKLQQPERNAAELERVAELAKEFGSLGGQQKIRRWNRMSPEQRMMFRKVHDIAPPFSSSK
jgi:hypothetical protein